MNKKRIVTDSLVISLSIIVITIVSVVLSDVFYDVNFIYTILIYLIAIIFYILYGWLIRRWFIINRKDKGDKALNHIFYYFLPVFSAILIVTLIVNLTILKNSLILMEISSSLLELVQISLFGIMIGIFLYSKIEKNLGSLVFKRIILPKDDEIGLRSVIKQTEYSIKNSWKIGMIILGSMIVVSNFLVFIVFPIIPAESISDTLTFTLPNFQYRFQAELGYRQEFFNVYDIPSVAIVDWKLAQSLMCFALFGIVVLLIVLPKKKENTKDEEDASSFEEPLLEESMENIAYNILTKEVKLEEYLPQEAMPRKTKSRYRKFYRKMQTSDLIQVMSLACLNIAASMLIILLLLNMGVPITSQIVIDPDTLFVQLSKLYWAGFNEEITFRFLLFGVPLFVINGLYFVSIKTYNFVSSKREIPEGSGGRINRYLSNKDPTNPFFYLTGRWKKLGVIDSIVLLISSYLFGYAHYQIGYPNWQVGKIFQAAVAGVIFGYAFYKFGLHAAIFLHVVNDFVIGMIITPNLGLIISGEILIVLITIFGALYLVYVLIIPISSTFKFFNKLLKRAEIEEEYM